jgi:hypothetical protein
MFMYATFSIWERIQLLALSKSILSVVKFI